MDNLLRLVDKFDGSDDVLVWLEKLKMLVKLQKVKEKTHEIIPIFLKGDAYEWYLQLSSETTSNCDLLEKALKTAFGIDSFDAFKKLRELKWRQGESVEVYLSTIKRLASACNINDESFILHSFITGLPEEAACQLRTQVQVSASTLAELTEKSRIILKESSEKVISMSMTSNRDKPKCMKCGRFGHISRMCKFAVRNEMGTVTCYRCGERGHIASRCLNAQSMNYSTKSCFKCGKIGHIASYCNVIQSENESGRSVAPVVSQEE